MGYVLATVHLINLKELRCYAVITDQVNVDHINAIDGTLRISTCTKLLKQALNKLRESVAK